MIDLEDELGEELENEEERTCDYCGEPLDEDQGYYCSKECAKSYQYDND